MDRTDPLVVSTRRKSVVPDESISALEVVLCDYEDPSGAVCCDAEAVCFFKALDEFVHARCVLHRRSSFTQLTRDEYIIASVMET